MTKLEELKANAEAADAWAAYLDAAEYACDAAVDAAETARADAWAAYYDAAMDARAAYCAELKKTQEEK